MSKIVTTSFKKYLDQITHQHVSKLAQMQDEQQMQHVGNELVNAPNMNVA
jgi:hypothetical protein